MKFEIQSTVSLAFLSIVNMCLCLQDYAEKTLSSFSTEFSIPWKDSVNSPLSLHHQHHHRRHDGSGSGGDSNHHHFNNNGILYDNVENFLLIDYLADGEMERRIRYNGITAKETSLGNSSKSLSLWQLSNGFAFIQMIFSNDDELIDCEYVRKKDFVNGFLTKFYTEIDIARSRNFTRPTQFIDNNQLTNLKDTMYSTNFNSQNSEYVNNEINDNDFNDAFGMRTLSYRQLNKIDDVPVDMLPLLNYPILKEQCDNRHRQLKRIVHDMNSDQLESRKNATEHLERKKRAISDWFIAPNTKWCGRGQNADKYNQLGGATKADKCCRRHDHCRFNIHAMTTKWHLFNFRPFTVSHCSCDMRQRRDLSNLLRIPGTKWCGKGWIATKYTDMGGLTRADRCCRQHDKSCPFWIMGFETKYGLFNWRVNTLMHCKCDERFRTCLKMADSSDATMVGKLFFNIVQSKCFVLKPEKICKKRSWWGKCTKKVLRKRAHLRDNRKF